jgi:DNA modification methylase
MENVIKTINRKQKQFDEMMNGIVKNVNGNSFNIKIDYNKMEHITDRYKLLCGDSAELIKTIESNSVGFSVFSPPFSNLFTYSDNIRDMGNCIDEDEFFTQTAYLLKELYRVIKPGRLVAVHTKDLARYKNSSGYSGMYDFTGDYHRAMELAGFKYHSKITIWIDPVLEMQRTKTQRLLHKQVTKDSSYSGIGMPEYITIFRKWEGDETDWEPIVNKTKDNFSINTWQKWASPIWAIENINSELDMIVPLLSQDAFDNLPDDILKKYANPCWYDIKRTNVLNNYKGAKDQKDEKHICPLQLDIIERCIAMWSNKGDTVFTPFMGIGSEIYQAVKMGRNGIGIELKESYYDLAIRNVESVANLDLQTSLF